MKKYENNESRYVGTNWDDVRVTENENVRGVTARKVITRGTHAIEAGELIAEMIAKLRQGYEVRLLDGNGNDALRVYPCVAKESDHMESCARTMNQLKASLNDKTVAMRGAKPKASGSAEEAESDEPNGVTPDIMMTCEVCGHRQRVGKKR